MLNKFASGAPSPSPTWGPGGLAHNSIRTPCPDSICTPWEYPEGCCDACEDPKDWELFDEWWCAITEWLFVATRKRFPGKCPVESHPCPPCGCSCLQNCNCGPWQVMDLTNAFCKSICVSNGLPCLEFVFPSGDGSPDMVIGPADGLWQLRPDLLTVDWCEPIESVACGLWPEQDVCDRPWSIRATVGAEPPKLLLRGAAKLVCEIVKDCTGKPNCLPDGVTSITRRGITADVGASGLDETITFDTEGTGIPQLDLALRTWGRSTGTVSRGISPRRLADERRRATWSYRAVLDPTPISFPCEESP